MKRILIIEVNWLGDILFTTPAIRAVRESLPDAHIAVLVVPRCVEMLKGNPHIDEIILLDEEKAHRGIFGKMRLISELKKRRFDFAISFHRSMTRVLIAYLAGIRERTGYYSKKRWWLLTKPVDMPAVQPHRIEYFLNIVRALGMDTRDTSYELFVSASDMENSDRILAANGIAKQEEFFVINPGGNWLPKRWPKENYAKLCSLLYDKYTIKTVITGSDKDLPLAGYIVNNVQAGTIISLCAKTTLKELAAVMKRAKAVVANDSGPMHIALSQNTAVVALFGPTSPSITGPYGKGRFRVIHKWSECRIPCYKACQDYRCMKAISVADAVKAVGDLIGR